MDIVFDTTPYIIWFFTWPVLLLVSYQLVKFALKKWEAKQ
jgi:hypothetical protein